MDQTASSTINVLCANCKAVNRVDPDRPKPVCGKCKGPLQPKAPGYLLEVTDLTFESQVLRAGLPVLVDFSATWCGPCRALEPNLKELAKELAGKVRVVQVDIDKSPLSARKYGVRGVPTLILFRGIEAGRISGALPPDELRKFVTRFISE